MYYFIGFIILMLQMTAYYFIWSGIKKKTALIRENRHQKKDIRTLILLALGGIVIVFSVFYLVYWVVAMNMGI